MAPTKLEIVRKQKNVTQKELADILPTDVSNYSRKERGLVKIYDSEWEKLAAALGVCVEDIKEVRDHKGNFISVSKKRSLRKDLIIEKLQKYIILLEKQNQELKEEIKHLLTKDINSI
ncbi:helix-turn-helix domain-containing protein [Chryseobacterium rhizosphaerae]|uniref:Transcriptional regulator n=1 Tax=Chryseobacterium rhizosphaerae TaxID=395937 RepID=A0ABX9IEK5_9FLAO|nr:helix-turn-helix transcriptional regulator [Chryseobacterium rhizosphaerae]REC70970.1 transcriptional regulator [Chryseobacterium rhizosphaerae]GEN69856.1 hypothetical protein CRH01_44240 [Chryseobacterium rhizosphaerae]